MHALWQRPELLLTGVIGTASRMPIHTSWQNLFYPIDLKPHSWPFALRMLKTTIEDCRDFTTLKYRGEFEENESGKKKTNDYAKLRNFV
jgi:hypothetical protein